MLCRVNSRLLCRVNPQVRSCGVNPQVLHRATIKWVVPRDHCSPLSSTLLIQGITALLSLSFIGTMPIDCQCAENTILSAAKVPYIVFLSPFLRIDRSTVTLGTPHHVLPTHNPLHATILVVFSSLGSWLHGISHWPIIVPLSIML